MIERIGVSIDFSYAFVFDWNELRARTMFSDSEESQSFLALHVNISHHI